LSRIVIAALVSGTIFVISDVNGAVVGTVGWMAGYGIEASFLAFRLRRMDQRRTAL